MRNYFFVFLVFLFVVSACVPNRKIIYLQNKGENKKKTSQDTLRKYNLKDFDYRVQVNDIIYIRYQSLTDPEFEVAQQQSTGSSGGSSGMLMRGDLVDENGEIPMQVVGKVKVAGLTVFQIQDTLQQLANRFLESAIIKVRLLNYRATILGEVNQEGSIVFQNNRVSLMEAIGLAGGLGELADRSHIKVIRQVNSETKVYYVNLLDEDFINSPYYYVHQNDLIIVPPLRQRAFRRYFVQDISIFLSAVSVALLIITFSKR